MKPAIVFALLYAGVLLAVGAVKPFFGEGGLYAVAVLSPLAIGLSVGLAG